MKIESNKVKVGKSTSELYSFLINPENFKQLMPENVETFEANSDGFTFALKGMPKVYLKLGAHEANTFVDYDSAKESLTFKLHIDIQEVGDADSNVQLLFEGSFNPFIKMMVEKPLTKFISTLEENIQKV